MDQEFNKVPHLLDGNLLVYLQSKRRGNTVGVAALCQRQRRHQHRLYNQQMSSLLV